MVAQLIYVTLITWIAILRTTIAMPLLVPANPKLYSEINLDGSRTPLIRLSAGEWGGTPYETTEAGYAVQKIKGYYKYLALDNLTGRLVTIEGVQVKRGVIPSNVTKGIKGRTDSYPSKLHVIYHNKNKSKIMKVEKVNGIPKEQSHFRRRCTAVTGMKANLVIAFKFSDHVNRTVPSVADINVLMNNKGSHPSLCPTGSVRDVYLKSSFGQLTLNSTVANWVTLPRNESFYSDGKSAMTSMSHIMIRDALDALQATGFNFLPFDQDGDKYVDSITFFHSGYGAEWGGTDSFGTYYIDRVWSHKWALYTLPGGKWTSKTNVSVYNYHISPSIWGKSGSDIGRIGVVAHEIGHYFGLPDLYDGLGGQGIGSYSLMANAWGSDGSQYYPPHMCAWSKLQLGWVAPVVITKNGTYSIRQACDYPEMYLINYNFPSNEYLLIENRQQCGFDVGIPGAGLAIFHIDDISDYAARGYPGLVDPEKGSWPMSGKHYKVALLQADGMYDMERDVNRGDPTDLFVTGAADSIGPCGTSSGAAYPNTNSYQGGIITDTGIKISGISLPGTTMIFNVSFSSPRGCNMTSAQAIQAPLMPIKRPSLPAPMPSIPVTRPKLPVIKPLIPVQKNGPPGSMPLIQATTPVIPVKRPHQPAQPMPKPSVPRLSMPIPSPMLRANKPFSPLQKPMKF